MRFNKLDLNLLVALDVLLAERSITRAAERLHISPAATSNALARLREHLGDPLLVQVGRRMETTPRADGLRDTVRDVLTRIDAGISARPAFHPAEADRRFRIIVSDFTMATLMPRVLELAFLAAPRVQIALLPQVEQARRALERGEVDLLVVPRDVTSADHPWMPLFIESYVCAVWSDSALARRPLDEAAFRAAGHVAVVSPHGRNVLDTWFERSGHARRIEVTTFSFALAPRLVLGTERIAIAHRHIVLQEQRVSPIALLDAPVALPRLVQTIQWHRYRTEDPGIAWLRGLMLQAAHEVHGTADTAADA